MMKVGTAETLRKKEKKDIKKTLNNRSLKKEKNNKHFDITVR